MKLRYKLAFLNLVLVMLMGIIAWPLSLNRYTFLRYIDPILLWDFQSFIWVVNRIRELVHLPLNLETFAVATTAIHYIFVIATGTIQWLMIGIICERLSAAIKSSQNAGNTEPSEHPTISSDSSKTKPRITTMMSSLCL
jgi:hypothetical protein